MNHAARLVEDFPFSKGWSLALLMLRKTHTYGMDVGLCRTRVLKELTRSAEEEDALLDVYHDNDLAARDEDDFFVAHLGAVGNSRDSAPADPQASTAAASVSGEFSYVPLILLRLLHSCIFQRYVLQLIQ